MTVACFQCLNKIKHQFASFILTAYKYYAVYYLLIKQGRKEKFYLMVHSAHAMYGYMAWDIW